MRDVVLVVALLAVFVAGVPALAARQPTFEKLGLPINTKQVRVQFVTEHDGRSLAWGVIESPGRHGVFAVYTDNGQSIWLDMEEYGKAHIALHRAKNGFIYIYAGRPGHFFKYDVKAGELTDLGVPVPSGTHNYFLGNAIGPDDKFYVGFYPTTHLVMCDPADDSVHDLGTITEDPVNKYIIWPAVSDDGVVYCPVGLHHAELWAYDTKTGKKTQIMPTEIVEGPEGRKLRCPSVRLGEDGLVYGWGLGKVWLCKPDGIEYLDKEMPRPHYDRNRRLGKEAQTAGDWQPTVVGPPGLLHMVHKDTEEKTTIKTDIEGATVEIWTVCCEFDGKVYGGGLKPAYTFSYDIETGKTEDLGMLGGGTIEVYDILCHPKGLFIGSYMGGNLDFFDPRKPRKKGENPRPIANLTKKHQQERPEQLVLGPDSMIYTGTVPIKGYLGGALARVNPDDFSVKVWRNLVKDQSLLSLAAVPETGELFVTSSIIGGTSAIPTEKEAFCILWDCKNEKVAWKGQPVPGAHQYREAVRAGRGLIYGFGDVKMETDEGETESRKMIYVFDPKKRKVVHTAEFPLEGLRWHGLVDQPIGPDNLIYGLAEGCIFTINPKDHSVEVIARHDSITRGLGSVYGSDDGVLHYGSKAALWKVDLHFPVAAGK